MFGRIFNYKNHNYFIQIFTFIVLPSIWRHFPTVDKWYSRQDREKQIDWNARTSAAIHAIIIFITSFYAIVFDENFTYKDIRR